MSVVGYMIGANLSLARALGGLALGFLFGALVARTNFCTMGAVSDILLLDDRRRMRAWLLAVATAMAGTQTLAALGAVDLEQSIYVSPRIYWVGHVLGGMLFGIGMVLAGGCVSRSLVRSGGGDVRALLVVLVVAIVALLAGRGPLEPLRGWLAGLMPLDLGLATQSVGDLAAAGLGIGRGEGAMLATAVVVLAMLAWCLSAQDFRRSATHIVSGLGVGLLVVLGWALNGLTRDELTLVPHATGSLTFVRPVADTLDWLVHLETDRVPGFGVAAVLGTLAGALVVAKWSRRFRYQSCWVDRGDAMRSLSGAVLMGFGGALGLGCTIGQGVTGTATLAIGSLLTLVSLVSGAAFGVVLLQRWFASDV
ncbi:MAG: YeeE/YedE family protein [Hyphomicrobiaceae bacterium]|nr:YeeE/YedE family protein [Hyphomicrobiaceae bacterium]